MNIKNISLSILLASMSACATCERHPVACTVGAVVVGAMAYGLARGHGNHGDPQRLCDGPSFPTGCHPIG